MSHPSPLLFFLRLVSPGPFFCPFSSSPFFVVLRYAPSFFPPASFPPLPIAFCEPPFQAPVSCVPFPFRFNFFFSGPNDLVQPPPPLQFLILLMTPIFARFCKELSTRSLHFPFLYSFPLTVELRALASITPYYSVYALSFNFFSSLTSSSPPECAFCFPDFNAPCPGQIITESLSISSFLSIPAFPSFSPSPCLCPTPQCFCACSLRFPPFISPK